MFHYIVTGGMGFLGKAFVKKLINENEKVSIIVKDRFRAHELWGESVNIIEQDLADVGSLNFPEEEGEERIIVHFAWEGTSGDKRAKEITQLNNVRLSCELLRKSKEWGAKRFINAGSIMEYEAMKTIAADGEHPQKNSIYSIAKLSADFMLKTIASDLDIEYINVIISNIYGPGEKSYRFLNSVVRAMIKNIDLNLTEGRQLYDFIYIDDAMNMIYAISQKGVPYESYYIGHARQKPLREYVIEAKNILNSDSKLLFGTIPFYGQALDYTEFNTYKAMELGVKPEVTFEEGINKMADWIRKYEETNNNEGGI